MHSTPTAMPENLPGDGNRHRPPLSGFGVVAVLAVFGFALIFQSSRWYKTPAYGNLLHIMSAPTWGLVYLAVAALMASGLILWGHRRINVAVHTVAFALLLSWEVSFVIRYLTDSATTVVNVMSWGAYMFLVIGSGLAIDRRPRL